MTQGARCFLASADPTTPTGSGGEEATITSGRRIAPPTSVAVVAKLA